MLQRQQQVSLEETRAKRERERAREARRALERAAARRARRQTELEHMIHRLETRLVELEGQLAVASSQKAVERVRQLGVEYSQVETELDSLLAAWTDMG